MKNPFSKSLIFFLAIYSGLSFAYAVSEEVNTLALNDAVKLALKNNKLIKISGYKLQSAKYSLYSSYGQFLPKLSVEGKFTKINEPIELDMNPIRSAMISSDILTLQTSGVNPAIISSFGNTLESSVPSFTTQIQKENVYNLSAQITQPIFLGGRLILNTAAKSINYKIAKNENAISQNNVLTEVVISYMKVQFMKNVVKIKMEVTEGILEHKYNSEKLFKEGLISKTIKLKTEVALSEAQREHFKATKERELAEILLNNALGEQNISFELVTPLFMPQNTPTLDYFIQKGLDNSPDLINLGYSAKLLKQKYKTTLSNFMPSISAFGKYELYKEDLTPFEPEWSAGVIGSINIFSGGSDYNNSKASLREVDASIVNLEYSKELIRTQIIKYFHDMEVAREQYNSIGKSLELGIENLKFNKNSFKQGLATSSDVIDAQIALSKVETEKAKALFDYDYALINLLNICGCASDFLNYSE